MSKVKLFAIAFALTTTVLSASFYMNRSRSTPAELVRIAEGVFLTAQLKPENIRSLRSHQIKTIVDLRPDGEAKDQASSAEIELASKRNRMDFHYIPVPHESIPDNAVEALTEVLSREATPALLYCRTGRRAVRTFALAKASQVDGPGIDAIIEMVRAAGFSAEDLRENITCVLLIETAHRSKQPMSEKPFNADAEADSAMPLVESDGGPDRPGKAGEYFLRCVVIALGMAAGVFVALFIGLASGWIDINC